MINYMYTLDQKIPDCEIYAGKWSRLYETTGSTQ